MNIEEAEYILSPKSRKTDIIWYDRPVRYITSSRGRLYEVELIDYTDDREIWRITNVLTREIEYELGG